MSPWKSAVRTLAAALLVTVACSCEKAPPPPPPTPAPTPTPVPTPKPTPKPTPTPTPPPTSTPATAAGGGGTASTVAGALPSVPPTPKPTPPKFAPEGVYYLVRDASVRLPAGILGVLAGTELHLLKENGDTLHVTDGNDEFDVKKSQVTNDLELAARIRRASDAAMADDARSQAQSEAILLKQQHDDLEYMKAHPLSLPTPSPTRH